MTTYSSWVTIFQSIFDACRTSKHPFFSGFEAEKGLRIIHACVVYTPFYGSSFREDRNHFGEKEKMLVTRKCFQKPFSSGSLKIGIVW